MATLAWPCKTFGERTCSRKREPCHPANSILTVQLVSAGFGNGERRDVTVGDTYIKSDNLFVAVNIFTTSVPAPGQTRNRRVYDAHIEAGDFLVVVARIPYLHDVVQLKRVNAAPGPSVAYRVPFAMREHRCRLENPKNPIAGHEIAASRRAELERLRATGTDDVRPDANITIVRTGFEGVSTPVCSPPVEDLVSTAARDAMQRMSEFARRKEPGPASDDTWSRLRDFNRKGNADD